jgi:PAS domain S-box-containing protein
MPFTVTNAEARLFSVLRAARRNKLAAYGISVAAVALATLGRLAIGQELMPGVPFITFYPAVLFATFFGGLGPGILAIVLSLVAAWYFFLPPIYSFAFDETATFTLAAFLLINAINVALIAVLNWALERVFAREQEVRTLIETAPNGIVVVDDQGNVKLVNATAEKLFGYTRLELIGQNVEVLVPDRLVNVHQTLRNNYMTAPETRAMGVGRDLNARRKDGSEFPIEIGLNAVSRDGRHIVLATVVDISERKKLLDRQRLIVDELRHRTQNLFAVIHTLASRSLDEKQSVAEARKLFLARIQALARAHAMLADAAWEGAPLDKIVQATLDAFTDRATVTGCDIVITPSAAQHFALILHELATNATKYGALSVPTGHITVEGKINGGSAEEEFTFLWQEIGGPPTARPIRRGFGSSVLVEAARGFGKRAVLDYPPAGVTYELVVPLSSIRAKPTAVGAAISKEAG